MASTLRKNIEDQVTCAICQERFTDPRLLPCLHTYCKECLENLIRATSRNGQITCPECKLVVQIHAGGEDQFKVNFQMNNLVSLLAISSLDQQNTKSEQLLCEYCTSNDPASGRCVDCCKFMCDYCINAHKRFLETRNHTIMTLDEVKEKGVTAMSQQPKCDKHKGEMMKLYCESCKQLICRDCTIIDHREHCYQFIDDVAQQHKKSLKAVLEDAIDVKAEVEKTKKVVEDMKAEITETCVNVEKEIKDLIHKEIFSVLKRKEASLKVQARQFAAERIESLNEQSQDLESKLNNLESSVQFTQDMLQVNDNVTILSVSSEASNRLSSLVEEMKQLNKQPCRQDKFSLHADQQSVVRSIEQGMVIQKEPKLDRSNTTGSICNFNQGNYTTARTVPSYSPRNLATAQSFSIVPETDLMDFFSSLPSEPPTRTSKFYRKKK